MSKIVKMEDKQRPDYELLNYKLLKSIDDSLAVVKWLMLFGALYSILNFVAELATVK